jgi:ribosome maturation factor RimP
MTNFGDAKRAESARADLPKWTGGEIRIGLVLLDDDHQEQRKIEGQVMKVGVDSLIFRRDGVDEEIPFAIIAKRVHGDQILSYG